MKKLVKGVTLTTLATMLASSIGCGSNFSTMIPMIDNNMLNSQLSYYQAKKLANRAETKDWTIFVHLAAENNLYSCGLDDINEMEAGLSATAAQNVNVIVLFDGIKNGDSVIYKIKPDKSYDKNIISEKINDKGEVIPVNTHEIDSGSKETFKKFLMWGVANFPAQNYMVDIWDHGSGIFRGKRTFLKKVFAMDDGTGSEMKTKDLNYVLPDVAKLAGKKIDILGFDACLMGHVEIGYQVKDSVNDINKRIGGLSETVGYSLEDKSYRALPELLKKDYGIIVEGKLKRGYLVDYKEKEIEVNIIGKGTKDGKELTIIGESKSKLSKSKVDEFIKKKLNRFKGVYKDIFPILVTNMIVESDTEVYVKQKNIAIYYSYDFEV